MAPEHEQFDDQILTRYLLGDSPQEEAERLDELSVADEEFAWRLSALENDLVDAYARGELSGKERERFEARYRLSARTREKVDFARGLAVAVQRSGTADAEPIAKQFSRPKKSLGVSSLFIWTPAAAALAMLLVAGYLFMANHRLEQQLKAARNDQRMQQLQSQLAQEQAAHATARDELERLKKSQSNLEQLKTASLVLPPPMRGAGRLTSLSLRPGTDLVVLFLTLESQEFPSYQATLKETATNQVVWRSSELQPQSLGEKKVVPVSLPSALLKAQNYVVELAGGPAGHSEVVGDYVFRAVLK